MSETDQLIATSLDSSQRDLLTVGQGNQFKDLSELFKEFHSTRNGLSNTNAKKIRETSGLNEIPTPLNYPAWLCCLLPCLLRTRVMVMYNNCVPDQSKILRDGRWLTMDSNSLVPGDIIKIRAGERVAADCRIIEISQDCFFCTKDINGDPAAKVANVVSSSSNYERSPNMAFLGYECIKGECTGLVVATGNKTLLASLIKASQWPPIEA